MLNLCLRKSLRADKKAYRNKVIERLCAEMDYAARSSPNGNVPYGFIKKILEEIKDEEPWVNRNLISFAYRKYCARMKKSSIQSPIQSSPITSPSTRQVGRPKGSTNMRKHHLKEVVLAAKNEIATIYLNEKEKRKKEGLTLPNGWLNNKIAEISVKRGIPMDISISAATIRSRKKDKIVLQGGGPESLMASVEPHLVELICAMAEFRRCLTTSEALSLGNDLIRGTPTEENIIKWKKARNEYKEDMPVLGRKWWKLFKNRWSHRLVTKRGQKFALDRSNALTYSNVKKMYDDVYECMVECGAARKLPEPSDQFVGDMKTKYELLHPAMCLVVDEVGSNISQRGDGHVTGTKYCCEHGTIPYNKASHNDRHFTLLGFTALTGEPVLCVVIISGILKAFEVEMGIDIDRQHLDVKLIRIILR